AQKDTLTPLIVSFFTTALNVLLAITLARPFVEGGLEHGGLALANGIAVGVEALIGLTILHFRWGGVDARRILSDALKAALAAAVMGAAIYAFAWLLQPGRLVLLLGGGVIGLVVYVSSALLLGLKEVRTLPLSVVHGLLRRERPES
ncbi:MAG: lipid II flippase MurJ, partial [Anaerolineales bacterium]